MNELTNDHQTILRDFNQNYPNHLWSDFVQTGPSHLPTFKVCLFINNTQFVGCGSTKKNSKISAINSFNHSRCTEMNSSVMLDVMENRKRKLTENSIQNQPPLLKQKITNTNCNIKLENEYHSSLKLQVMDTSTTIVPQISPISILHEMFPEQTLAYEYEGQCGILVAVSVHVSGNKYTGYGSNKKEAKEIACRNALIALYEEDPLNNHKYQAQIEMLRTDCHDAKIIDRFAYITGTMHQELDLQSNKIKEYTVIASIMKVINNDFDSAEIICLATGTKCISGNYLSLSGESLNDCHAEIIARRCLIKYLYKELIDCVKKRPSIFILDKKKIKFKFLEDVGFHLYINTAPCGEARVYGFSDSEKNNNRLNRGLLRSKIENGAGTVQVLGREIQTYDGIAQGERLITMSCSDKLTRWNVLGLQGNLLSNFVEPIYLHSVTIGSQFNMAHMVRTIYGRIEKSIDCLPEEYKVHKPELRGYGTLPRRGGSVSPYCVNWIENNGVEVIEGKTGRTIENKPSRLCKSAFAKDYISLCHATNSLSTITKNNNSVFYDSLKSTNTNYLAAKHSLMLAFKFSDFGTWVKKPEELVTFELDVDNILTTTSSL